MPADSATQLVFPFFVGCGRSGTTLFRAIFDSHSHMAIPGESHLPSLLRKRRHYERDAFRADEFVNDVLSNRAFREWWRLPGRELRRRMETAPPRDLADAIRGLYSLYAERAGKIRYGDKTPAHVLHIPRLASLFQESRFVHIVRDGRDVALSYLEVAWGPRSVEEAAIRWRRFVEAGRRAGVALGGSRYREVRYEDLVLDPQTIVRSLCPYLDLEFEESMLRYFERPDGVIGSMGHPESHQRLREPPTAGRRDWRKSMSQGDLEMFEALAGDLLEELGYERAFDRVPRKTRVVAGWRRGRLEAERHAREAVRATNRIVGRTRRVRSAAARSCQDKI